MKLKDQTPGAEGISDVQARLMKMLESVRLEDDAPPARPPAPVQASVSKVGAATLGKGTLAPAKPAGKPGTVVPGNGPPAPKPPGSTCTNCDNTESWGQSGWCPKCGWYPKLNRVMEGVAQTGYEDPEAVDLTKIDIDKYLPPWVWSLASGVGAILLMNIVVRMLVPDISTRGSFGLFQLMVGVIACFIAHVKAYLIAAMVSTKYTPPSMFLMPVQLWKEVINSLPKSRKVMSTLVCGMTAMMLAVSVVGLDWTELTKVNSSGMPKINPFKWMMKGVMAMAKASAQASAAGRAASGGAAPVAVDPELQSLEGSMMALSDLAAGDILAQSTNGAMGNAGADIGAFAAQAAAGGELGAGEGLPGGVPVTPDFSSLSEGGPAPGGLTESISAFADNAGAAEALEGGVDGGVNSGAFNPAEEPVSDVKLPGISTDVSPADLDGPIRVVAPITANTSALTGQTRPRSSTNPTQTPSGSTPPKGENNPVPANYDRREFVVFGYTTNISGEIRSLLMAEISKDKRGRFVGRLALDDVGAGMISALDAEFKDIRVSKPAVACPYGGRWVRPIVYCNVAFDGFTADGKLNDARLLSFQRK